MAWYRCTGGNGSGLNARQVLVNGQISDTSHYITSYFSDISDLEEIFLRYSYIVNDTSYIAYGSVKVSDITESGSFSYRLDVPQIYDITVTLTRTSITGTHYSGQWRDIYVDIIGITEW